MVAVLERSVPVDIDQLFVEPNFEIVRHDPAKSLPQLEVAHLGSRLSGPIVGLNVRCCCQPIELP
jgi:hypothetical protein